MRLTSTTFKTINKGKLISLPTVSIFILFIIVNSLTPLLGEDYSLLLKYNGEGIITYIGQIISRIHEQIAWNMRLGDSLTIMFLSVNKVVFNLFNSIVGVYFFVLVFFWGHARVPNLRTKEDTTAFIFPVIIYLITCPVLGEIFFWACGSLNYLWSICILLTCGIPFRLLLRDSNYQMSSQKKFMYILFSFFAGFTNENTVPVIVALGCLLILIQYTKKKRVPLWIVGMVLAFSSGWAVLVFSESTKNRTNFYRKSLGLPENRSLHEIYENSLRVIKVFFQSSTPIILVLSIILLIFFMKRRGKKTDVVLWKLASDNFLLLVLSTISIVTLIMAPYTEMRAFLLVHVFILSFISKLAVETLSSSRTQLFILKRVVLFIVFLIFSFKIIQQNYLYYNFDLTRESEMIIQKQQGNRILVAEEKFINNRLLNNREDYIYSQAAGGNQAYARYYGVDGVYWSNSTKIVPFKQARDYLPLSNQYRYVLEGINGQELKQSYIVKNDKPIEVRGWIVNETFRKVPDQAYIILDNSEIYPCFWIRREDVAQSLGVNDYLHSGFYSSISLNEKDIGSHELNLLVIEDNKTFYVPLGISINVTN